MIYIVYLITVFLFSIYSYSLVDPNLTLINNQGWTIFRNFMVQLGYYQRSWSVFIFVVFLVLLTAFYFFFKKNSARFDPLKLALIVGLITLIAYPFLSHDFFNYLFDAKIFTFYHQNPYLHRGLDFPHDPWIRFMHWTHRTYPYGPVFLGLTIIPSFLSFGKFILSYFFFKLLWLAFYLLSVFYLKKMNNKWAIVFATHPLIIIEGLVNLHNDFIGLALAIIGIYFLLRTKKSWLARGLLILSGGIKYITLPLIGLFKKRKLVNYLILLAIIALLSYLSLFREIQPWYFLALFAFLPFFPKLIEKLDIFFFGLLLSYYPYIAFGGWDKAWKVQIKHQIILVLFIINVVYLFFLNWKERLLYSHEK